MLIWQRKVLILARNSINLTELTPYKRLKFYNIGLSLLSWYKMLLLSTFSQKLVTKFAKQLLGQSSVLIDLHSK